MAMHEITQIGYTESGVNTIVANEATNKDIGDNALIAKVNTQLISRDEQNKELTERNDAQTILLNQEIDNVRQARYNSLGVVNVEPTLPTENLTVKINQVASYYDVKANIFAGLESTSSLTTKSNNVNNQQVLNDSRLDEMEANIDPNSFKEVYDKVMAVDVNDPNTVLGFEAQMRRNISKLADQGVQEKGKCLIYKDENTKAFYEMYIQNGLISLEQVPNPDKDVISSYLVKNSDVSNSFLENRSISRSEVFNFGDNYYYVLSVEDVENVKNDEILVEYKTYTVTNNVVNHVNIGSGFVFVSNPNPQNTVFHNVSFHQIDDEILIMGRNSELNVNQSRKVLKFNPETHRLDDVTSAGSKYFSFNHVSLSTLSINSGLFGVCDNNTQYFISGGNNSIMIFNKSGVLSSILTMPGYDFYKSGYVQYNFTNNSLVATDDHLFVLAYKKSSNKLCLTKWLLSDNSFVSEVVIDTNPTIHFQHIFKIGGKIAHVNYYNRCIVFYNPYDMVKYGDNSAYGKIEISNITSGENLFNSYAGLKSKIIDLGNEKILIANSTKMHIFTYDGYEIYSELTGNIDVCSSSTVDKIIYTKSNYQSHNSMYLTTTPVYKYK